MAAAAKFPTLSAAGLPVTLSVYVVNLAELASIPRSRTVSFGPQSNLRKEGKVHELHFTENTKLVGEAS